SRDLRALHGHRLQPPAPRRRRGSDPSRGGHLPRHPQHLPALPAPVRALVLSTLRIEPAARARGRRVADAIYGTILVLAVVAALSKDEQATAGAILGGALATSVVFWIVHVYAEVLDREVEGATAGGWSMIRTAAWQEFPL